MEDYSCRYSSGLSPDSLSSGGYSHRIAILTGAKIQIIFKIYKKSLHFSENNVYLCSRNGDTRVFHPCKKRESGANPEQYPLLSSPLW